MPCAVIVGGQYGSEGKGKVCAYLAAVKKADIMVRCGGPNSGHTVADGKHTYILKQLPAGAPHLNCRLLIPAGAYVVPELLFHEIETFGVDERRIGIDKNCVVVSQDMVTAERNSNLQQTIGSTLSGTGAAVNARIQRHSEAVLAKNTASMKKYVTSVADEIRASNKKGKTTIIEGTQGFGLSLYHSSCYPFVTSRDTTAAAFASEAGISPRDIDEIVLVIRAFPIRVGGNSGPLPKEITWEQLTKKSDSPENITEHTSVTNRLRRIAEFDSDIVRKAIQTNNPTHIVLNHLDYVNWKVHCIVDINLVPQDVISFVRRIEHELSRRIDLFGVGPCTNDFISSIAINQLVMEKANA